MTRCWENLNGPEINQLIAGHRAGSILRAGERRSFRFAVRARTDTFHAAGAIRVLRQKEKPRLLSATSLPDGKRLSAAAQRFTRFGGQATAVIGGIRPPAHFVDRHVGFQFEGCQ